MRLGFISDGETTILAVQGESGIGTVHERAVAVDSYVRFVLRSHILQENPGFYSSLDSNTTVVGVTVRVVSFHSKHIFFVGTANL